MNIAWIAAQQTIVMFLYMIAGAVLRWLSYVQQQLLWE